MSLDKVSTISTHCRICHEGDIKEKLIEPCECTGSLGLIHTTCLEKWLSISNSDCCEICKFPFIVERKHKSISQWWRSRQVYGPQGIGGDAICLIILTPLCLAATYLCGLSAYARLGFLEGTGLAVLCCMLGAAYCLWLVVTVRFYYKSWQKWRESNLDIKLVAKRKGEKARRRTSWLTVANERNNNESNGGGGRFSSWFLVSYTSNEDPPYAMQQTTAV